MNVLKNTKIHIILISIILGAIPFFWLKPGEMDLGGDSNRFYFYDPINYLKSGLLSGFNPDTLTSSALAYYLIPFVSLLFLCKQFVHSPWMLMTLFNSFQLILGFLSMYWISMEFLKDSNVASQWRKHLASIAAGLFYILAPSLTPNWGRALYIHVQVFLNPLIFFLLLKFVHTQKAVFALVAILISFFFAQNFSPSPYFFSFFPFIFLFIAIYVIFIKRSKLAMRNVVILVLLFFIVQLFNYIPQFQSFFTDPNHLYKQYAITEGGKYSRGLHYFLSVLPQTWFVKNLIALPQGLPAELPPLQKILEPLWFFFPVILIMGLHKSHTLFLLFAFYLMSFYLVTAHITDIGTRLYIHFFDIPGFTMFRNFVGQFSPTFIFFYSLVIGETFFYLLGKLSIRLTVAACIFVISLLIISSYDFISGNMMHIVLNKGQPVEYKIATKMDPIYEQAIEFMRNDPKDGRIISLPLSDGAYSMVAGTQGGMYFGTSPIAYLTGKQDLNGYGVILPFSETFFDLIKTKDYQIFENLLSLLNIRYIFHNDDEQIYKYFPDYPYNYVRKILPPDSRSNRELLKNLRVKEKINFGNRYYIYELDAKIFLPRLYIAKKIEFFDRGKYVITHENGNDYTTGAFYQVNDTYERRTTFLEEADKGRVTVSGLEEVPRITFTKVNPTRYIIQIQHATGPYLLTFSQAFNPNWHLYLADDVKEQREVIDSYFAGEIREAMPANTWASIDMFSTIGKTPVANSTHVRANAYANAWFIHPEDVGKRANYTLVLESNTQRIFYITFAISLIGVLICFGSLAFILIKRLKHKSNI